MDPLPNIRLARLPSKEPLWGQMQLWWQRIVEQIEAAINGINTTIIEVVAAQAAADAAQDTAIAAANDAASAALAAASAQTTADSAVTDASTALALAGSAVQIDVGPAWTAPTGTASRATFATYTAPAISAVPTQAEVQAIADHVQTLSRAVKALVDDLQGNGSLT